VTGEDRPRAVELLGEEHAHQPVRQRERGERHELSARSFTAASSPSAPPIANAGCEPSRIQPASIVESPWVVTALPRSSRAMRPAPSGIAARRRAPSAARAFSTLRPAPRSSGFQLDQLHASFRRHAPRVLVEAFLYPRRHAVSDREDGNAHVIAKRRRQER
jgi:hypothetical protein